MKKNNSIKLSESIAISGECRHVINHIKNNLGIIGDFTLKTSDALRFTNLAWRLLGRYIANNTQLESIDLEGCRINDDAMTSLFGGLIRSDSIKELDIQNNIFGIEGVRCMVPFLENSQKLSSIDVNGSNTLYSDFDRIDSRFNTECFEVLIRALHGRPIKKIYPQNCIITDISTLGTYTLPNLQQLTLSGNRIGREGCISLSHLLRKEGTRLKLLDLEYNRIGDEGAGIIASSLENNTKLKRLYLHHNNITQRGSRAFFVLLNNASSIERAYYSNYTLTTLSLRYFDPGASIDQPIHMNRRYENESSHAAGRAKVVKVSTKQQEQKETVSSTGYRMLFCWKPFCRY